MRILYVTSNDAEAQWNVNIIKELKKRRHVVDIKVTSDEQNFVETYQKNNLKYSLLGNNQLNFNCYDMLSCTGINIPNNIFCFKCDFSLYPTSGSYYQNIIFVGGDLIKDICIKRRKILKEVIPVGFPRLDNLYGKKVTNEKYFLFTDNGAYPPTPLYRLEFLKVLCNIAKKFPDYKFLIKPRYKYKIRNKTAHYHTADFNYLINEIKDRPENIEILEEWESLEDLIMRCSVLITFPSSTAIFAFVLNKPVVILDRIKEGHEDIPGCFPFESILEFYKSSGCVISCDELQECLPYGLKAHDWFVQGICYKFDGKASARVVDWLEEFYKITTKTTVYLPSLNIGYENYKKRFEEYLIYYNQLDETQREFVKRLYFYEDEISLFRENIFDFVISKKLPVDNFLEITKPFEDWIDVLKDLNISNEKWLEIVKGLLWHARGHIQSLFGDREKSSLSLNRFYWFFPLIAFYILIDFKEKFERNEVDMEKFLFTLIERYIDQNGNWLWIVYLFIYYLEFPHKFSRFLSLISARVNLKPPRPYNIYWKILLRILAVFNNGQSQKTTNFSEQAQYPSKF